MPRLALRKRSDGLLMPAGPEDAELVAKIKPTQVIRANFKRVRNYLFLQKWFCLARFAYDHWETGELQDARWKGVVPEKSFDRFRRDLIILAGYFEATYRMDGSVRIEAKSIAFDNMKEEEFDLLYSATVDVVLKRVLQNYTRDDLEYVVEQTLGFS